MAVDLFCYASLASEQANPILDNISVRYPKLFSCAFFISRAGNAKDIDKEISMAYGLKAESEFMVSLNDKDMSRFVIRVAKIIKESFGENRVVVLHNNELLL